MAIIGNIPYFQTNPYFIVRLEPIKNHENPLNSSVFHKSKCWWHVPGCGGLYQWRWTCTELVVVGRIPCPKNLKQNLHKMVNPMINLPFKGLLYRCFSTHFFCVLKWGCYRCLGLPFTSWKLGGLSLRSRAFRNMMESSTSWWLPSGKLT